MRLATYFWSASLEPFDLEDDKLYRCPLAAMDCRVILVDYVSNGFPISVRPMVSESGKLSSRQTWKNA